ncbi:MAG TPA: flagellar biosynthesis protein FlhF [Burkholderiaceae bacterium]
MNVKRFTARTSRDALSLVRQALGDDAVVLSTKPSAGGVEVLAMAPEGLHQVERMAAKAPVVAAPAAPVEEDVAKLSMSTLSFQDYVRERLLRRRQTALKGDNGRDASGPESRFAEPALGVPPLMMAAPRQPEPAPVMPAPIAAAPALPAAAAAAPASVLEQRMNERAPVAAPLNLHREAPVAARPAVQDIHIPGLADDYSHAAHAAQASARRDQEDMMNELRSMKGLIEERFGALAFIEKMQRQPAQARMTQKLLDAGFSPALIRKLGDSLPAEVADESAWAANVLERNLPTAEAEAPLEDQGGVYALIGATGVGKTTTTAKIAAAFATKYGAGNLGLITLDAYRIGAHEQLRAYGRILGVPVHTAHDRASLEDLLELLGGKKMVLIDTAGMAQRDTRTRELLEMLSHRTIRKLLVVNAASQGETIEDVMISYRVAACAGVVLSKMDEAVKLGPALDALIRHRVKVIGVANGQRVPEDWHRLSANALVHRALRGGGSSAYKLDASDVNLIFTAATHGAAATRGGVHA